MKIKKSIILLLITTIILGISFKVKAAEGDSYSLKMSADKTKVKAGETITISLKLDNIKIESGEKGIGSYEGSLIYDTKIFESVKMAGNDDWDTPFQNEGRFTAARSDGECVSEAQEIATIKLKVKSDAKEGETTIEIKDFSASNAVENIKTADSNIKVKIEKEDTGDKNNTTDGDNTTGDKNNTTDGNNTTGDKNNTTNGNNTTGGNTSTGDKKENNIKNTTTNTKQNSTVTQKNMQNQSTATGILPKAGVSKTLVIFIVISVISGICGYIKYRKTY